MSIERVWDICLEYGIATQKELELVTSINGYNIGSLEDVIYSRTGYKSVEQFLDEE